MENNRITDLKFKTQAEMINALSKLDRFQNHDAFKIETNLINQLSWIQKDIPNPRAIELLDQWKEIGSELIAELSKDNKRGGK